MREPIEWGWVLFFTLVCALGVALLWAMSRALESAL